MDVRDKGLEAQVCGNTSPQMSTDSQEGSAIQDPGHPHNPRIQHTPSPEPILRVQPSLPNRGTGFPTCYGIRVPSAVKPVQEVGLYS